MPETNAQKIARLQKELAAMSAPSATAADRALVINPGKNEGTLAVALTGTFPFGTVKSFEFWRVVTSPTGAAAIRKAIGA